MCELCELCSAETQTFAAAAQAAAKSLARGWARGSIMSACHLISEHMRTREKATLKSIVLEGSLWESHWVSYFPAMRGSGGSAQVSDTPAEHLAETGAAKRVAALARSEWDNYSAASPNKRAWNNQGTGSKPFGSKGLDLRREG